MFPGVIAHPRVVPREGAVISGTFIPGGVRFDPSLPLAPTHPHCILLFFSHTWFFRNPASADRRGPEFLLRAPLATYVRAPGSVPARAVAGPKFQGVRRGAERVLEGTPSLLWCKPGVRRVTFGDSQRVSEVRPPSGRGEVSVLVMMATAVAESDAVF